MNATVNPASNSAVGKGCVTLFLALFVLAGLVFAGLMFKFGFVTAEPYWWEPADCTILESSVQESRDSVKFHVRYSYRFNGRDYTSTQFSKGMDSTVKMAAAIRNSQRYAPGTRTTCHVNPSQPGESVIERGSFWVMLFLIIPLMFVVFGVAGIIGVWRSKPAVVTAISDRHTGRRGTVLGIRFIASVFIAAGWGMLYSFFIQPSLKAHAAAGWPRVPCEIVSSRVVRHPASKGNSTYSLDVRYRYRVDGRDYTGGTYGFESGSSSNRGWRAAAVKKYPPGLKTVCYVNPADPVEAVLSVDPAPDRWFGLIPAAFLLVGLVVFFKAPAMSGRTTTGMPLPAASGVPGAPAASGVGGPVQLKPASTPLRGFIVISIFALIWNGFVWAMFLGVAKDAGARFFLGIFGVIGAGLLAIVAYQFLALFNPRPVISASSQAIPLGGTLEIQWRFTGNVRRLRRLRITLEGREEATYRRGTTTTTDRNIFADLALAETVDRIQMGGGSARLTIPAELIHTFTAANNKIVWTLRVAGEVPKWPDVNAEFPITVLPCEATAGAVEETSAS